MLLWWLGPPVGVAFDLFEACSFQIVEYVPVSEEVEDRISVRRQMTTCWLDRIPRAHGCTRYVSVGGFSLLVAKILAR